MWEFGDYGSILVLAKSGALSSSASLGRASSDFEPIASTCSDEDATDRVLYSTDEGLNWKAHDFGERLFIKSIQTIPQDTSRKFLLFGHRPSKPEESVSVFVDFSALTSRQCASLAVSRCRVNLSHPLLLS